MGKNLSIICQGLPPSDDQIVQFEHSDTEKIASGHILKFRCKAGVTQSLLPMVVEMNEAVVDSDFTNVTSKLIRSLMAHGIHADDSIAIEVREVIDSHRNPLQSLHSIHCQTSVINNHYNIVLSHLKYRSLSLLIYT